MVTLSFTWPAKQNRSRACSPSDNVQLSARTTSLLQVWYENSNAEMLNSFWKLYKVEVLPVLIYPLPPLYPLLFHTFSSSILGGG